MLRKFFSVLVLAALSTVTSCTDQPSGSGDKNSASTSSSSNTGAAAPVSGATAFWAMYKEARTWTPDLEPLNLESKSIPGIKNADGKAAMWTATFGSPGKRQARVFTYAVAAHPPEIYKGVTVGQPITWGGPTKDATTFATTDLQVDSDAAYKTALGQASGWLKEHPDKELSCTLGNAERFKAPVWYMLWGDSKSGYAVFVDAKSGAIVNQKK